MSVIKPFRALRPSQNDVEQVASVPYDVVNVAEARRLVEGNPHSFLHVTRAEIDLPENVNVYSAEVYAKAKENLENLQKTGVLVRETAPAPYIYRLTMNGRQQTSVVACCAIDEYDEGLIKKHEKTRPDKENDRTNHIVTTRAQTGLIFLCYRGTDAINSLVEKAVSESPLYDFTAADGIHHEIWRVAETAELVEAFAEVPALYVADGHHRAASAARARESFKNQNENHSGTEDYNTVIAALFPAEQLEILAYNRVVKDLNGFDDGEFLNKLKENFAVAETSNPVPAQRGEFCLYLGGKWFSLKPTFKNANSVIENLDVSVLENHVLCPILGIEDVRTDKRIDFVGGIRGTAELEKLVDSGNWKIAFSMFPTTIDDLLKVADANEIMPPKSTWFEPKLRDGLLVHLI
jgi:uncharacterized protein (DUF1015 family)